MIQITLQDVGFDVTQSPAGRTLVLADRQSGITVVIPFDENGVAALRAKLSGIAVAQVLPANGDGPFRGGGGV
jgi:hypothetical protein